MLYLFICRISREPRELNPLEILEEVNYDRNEDWTDYDMEDFNDSPEDVLLWMHDTNLIFIKDNEGEWTHYDVNLESEENPNHFLYPKIENAEYDKENHA